MTKQLIQSRNFIVTTRAANHLIKMREQYDKPLRFRVFVNHENKCELRLHDKEYSSDWTIDINGVGISFSTEIMEFNETLILEYTPIKSNNAGFQFELRTQSQKVAVLDGDDAISRILSEEVEICDAYGEYCYSTYT